MPNLYTEQEIMSLWDENASDATKAKNSEIEAIRKDISTARKYIADALARYRKDKTRSRSKAKGADPFAELADYNNENDIQNAYGYDVISEAEMERLMHLWRVREESKSQKVLVDRVTEMLEHAAACCSDQYDDILMAHEDMRNRMREEARKIAKENRQRDWEKRHEEY